MTSREASIRSMTQGVDRALEWFMVVCYAIGGILFLVVPLVYWWVNTNVTIVQMLKANAGPITAGFTLLVGLTCITVATKKRLER